MHDPNMSRICWVNRDSTEQIFRVGGHGFIYWLDSFEIFFLFGGVDEGVHGYDHACWGGGCNICHFCMLDCVGCDILILVIEK